MCDRVMCSVRVWRDPSGLCRNDGDRVGVRNGRRVSEGRVDYENFPLEYKYIYTKKKKGAKTSFIVSDFFTPSAPIELYTYIQYYTR